MLEALDLMALMMLVDREVEPEMSLVEKQGRFGRVVTKIGGWWCPLFTSGC